MQTGTTLDVILRWQNCPWMNGVGFQLSSSGGLCGWFDFSKEREVKYAAFLEVKMVEAEGEIHVFHMLHPESEATHLLQKQMSEFIHIF